MKVIDEFKCVVSFKLPHEHGAILRKMNKHHTGQETAPLDEEFPPTKHGHDLKDVHHRIHTTYSDEVIVQVMEDGRLRLKRWPVV